MGKWVGELTGTVYICPKNRCEKNVSSKLLKLYVLLNIKIKYSKNKYMSDNM